MKKHQSVQEEQLLTLKEIKRLYSINCGRHGDLLSAREIDWLINRVDSLETSVQGLIDNLNKSNIGKRNGGYETSYNKYEYMRGDSNEQ